MLSHLAKPSADLNLFHGSSISQWAIYYTIWFGFKPFTEQRGNVWIHEVTDFWWDGIKWYVLIIYFYVCNVIFQGLMSITQQAFNNFNPCSLFSVVQQHIVHVLLRQKISSMLLVKIMSWSIWSFFNIKPSQKTQLYFLSLMFLRYI